MPTVIDRTIQWAIAQQLMPIYEPLFIEMSYDYRPNKSAKDAILKVKEYAEQASERLLESSTKYLEEKLKLTVNRDKSRTVSVFAI